WADKYGYPLKSNDDLAKVAQFLTIEQRLPKQLIAEALRPDPAWEHDAEDPHNVLARLPALSLFVTTNYDPLMTTALTRNGRHPIRKYCRWSPYLEQFHRPSIELKSIAPTAAKPLVYHLHGVDSNVNSLVLTEDDYLEFLVRLAHAPDMVPGVVQERMVA